MRRMIEVSAQVGFRLELESSRILVVLGHLCFIAGPIEQQALADRRATDCRNAVDRLPQRGNQRFAFSLGERGPRAEEDNVRNHLSFFFPVFDSQRLRMVCLKRPHLAFFASLYF